MQYGDAWFGNAMRGTARLGYREPPKTTQRNRVGVDVKYLPATYDVHHDIRSAAMDTLGDELDLNWRHECRGFLLREIADIPPPDPTRELGGGLLLTDCLVRLRGGLSNGNHSGSGFAGTSPAARQSHVADTRVLLHSNWVRFLEAGKESELIQDSSGLASTVCHHTDHCLRAGPSVHRAPRRLQQNGLLPWVQSRSSGLRRCEGVQQLREPPRCPLSHRPRSLRVPRGEPILLLRLECGQRHSVPRARLHQQTRRPRPLAADRLSTTKDCCQ